MASEIEEKSSNKLTTAPIEKLEAIENGKVVDREIWQPILGGPISQVIRETVKNGGKVTIVGSAVMQMLGGIYAYEAEGHLPRNQITDIDCYVEDGPDEKTAQERGKHFYDTQRRLMICTGSKDIPKLSLQDFRKYRDLHSEPLRQAIDYLRNKGEEVVNPYEVLPETPAQYAAQTYLFEHETISLTMELGANQELQMILNDPKGIAKQAAVRFDTYSTRHKMQALRQNPLSAESIILRAAAQGALDLHEKAVRWSSNVTFPLTHSVLYNRAGDPDDGLWNEYREVMKRLYTEVPAVREEYYQGFAKDFVKSAILNPHAAYHYVLSKFPLGDMLSPEVGAVFACLQERPENEDMEQRMQDPQFRYANAALLRLGVCLTSAYDHQWTRLAYHPWDIFGLESYEYTNRPQSMNELVASLVVALGWDSVEYQANVESIVTHWNAHVENEFIERSWKGLQEDTFKVTVDVQGIMKSCKQLKMMQEEKGITLPHLRGNPFYKVSADI